MNTNISIFHYFILTVILFLIGFFGIILSKNLVKILLSLIFMINSVCINFVAISHFCDGIKLEGITMALFILFICVSQITIFIAIIINMYKHKQINQIDKLEELKG